MFEVNSQSLSAQRHAWPTLIALCYSRSPHAQVIAGAIETCKGQLKLALPNT